jgi:hypothetical protein
MLCIRKMAGRVIAHADSCWFLTAEAPFRYQVSPFGICGGQYGSRRGFSPSTSVFPCQYNSSGHSRIIYGLDNRPVSGRSFTDTEPLRIVLTPRSRLLLHKLSAT